MIEIKEYNKERLRKLIEDSSVWKQQYLPITRARAISHANNPMASGEDIMLLVAYDDENVIAYMGAFIDCLRIDGHIHKIAWLSTWWADPTYKTSGIGRELLHKMYKLHDGKIGISQFTQSAKRVYDKSGYFTSLKLMSGIKASIKPEFSHLIPALYPKAKKITPLLMVADRILNGLVDLKLYFLKNKISDISDNVSFSETDQINDDLENFIRSSSQNDLTVRNKSFLNWMKQFPWLTVTNDGPDEKYFFSSTAKRFQIHFIVVKEDARIVGFLVLQIRDNTLKVLYTFFDVKMLVKIGNYLIRFSLMKRVKTIITYDQNLVRHFGNNKSIFIYLKPKVKEAIISKVFNKDDFENYRFHFGDGDCSFA